ncbi:penicillin-binding protein 2 [candidate division KSB1 bacterium]|nr:penicillin-binding protein 2 [candidate division KSB1 bacterium]
MNSPSLETKKYIFYSILYVAFFVLIARFFYLQIYRQAQYFQESEKNRIRQVVLQPTRGLIYDRNGEVLVDNRPSYSVFAIPFEVRNADSTLELAGNILDLELSEMKKKIRTQRSGFFTPVKLKRQIGFDVLSKLEENRLDLPGIIYQTEPRRSYPSGVRAPHVFGYLGEVTQREIKQFEHLGYRLGDIVGKKGLEKVYDGQLQGLRGSRYIEVDALGREVRVLKDKPEILPLPGKDLHLSMDRNLQEFLETRMDTLRGGAVVADCRNGEIIALVSKPDYEPEIFTKPIPPDTWNELINDPHKPLYDRMVQSLYPPGSTFKLVLAAAALENNIISPSWISYCNGMLLFGRRTFDCWKKPGHGDVNLFEAIEQSCNVYFYKLGLKVGLENWSDFARKLRFGKKTGIDIINENSGLVPDQQYLDNHYGKNKWSRGLLLNLAVGQGDLLVTPLQIAAMSMIFANRGMYYRFHLVRYIEDPIDHTRRWSMIDSVRVNGISQSTYDVIREGMYRVVNGAKGTARVCWFPDIRVAAKTGTAQNPHGEDHAWITGFAPYENPEIAFCVLVENGGSGGAVAGPIARGIIQNYFDNKRKNLDKYTYDIR